MHGPQGDINRCLQGLTQGEAFISCDGSTARCLLVCAKGKQLLEARYGVSV